MHGHVEHPDGSEASVTEGLLWDYDDHGVSLTLAADYLRPGQTVELRWDPIVPLRDQIEQALRAWNAHELARGAPAVIDYDCHPQGPDGNRARRPVDDLQRASAR